MKLYVGVTDNDWYRFLSQLPNVKYERAPGDWVPLDKLRR